MHGRIPEKPQSYAKTTRGKTTITIEPSTEPTVIEFKPLFGKGRRYRIKVDGEAKSKIEEKK